MGNVHCLTERNGKKSVVPKTVCNPYLSTASFEVKELDHFKIVKEFDYLKIQMEEIISATDNFSQDKLIGRGGFGPVYKGELSLSTGKTMVAFKRLDRRLGQGNIEFWKEILMLSICKHENLVSLLHFSVEGDDRVLVYEYASRGSLDRYISDASLTWNQRLHICIRVAHALNYLHDPMKKQRVLHRDIKSSNILLDENWSPKVSDFGLSRIGPSNHKQTYLVSNVVGTFGYCDPLYWEMGFLSKESDVYSFGVVLFEVMCGRLCYEHGNGELIGILVKKWKKCYDEKKLNDIIFQDLKEQIVWDSLITFSTIANRCLNRDRGDRPTMDEIVEKLEFAFAQQNISHDLLEISKLALSRLSYKSENELISVLSKGIVVDEGKRWVSLNENKEIHEMISATHSFDGLSYKFGTNKDSRFSNIFTSFFSIFKINVTTKFLSPHVTYSINLIFKHEINKYWIYVPFKYKLEEEIHYSRSRIIQVREDGWLTTELYQFTSYEKEHNFKIEFVQFATTTHSRDFEGIEFRPIEQEMHEDVEDKPKVDMQEAPNLDVDWEQKLSPEYINLIKLSKDNKEWTSKKELYLLLRKGFLIDQGGDKWLSISKNKKKRLMIPASEMLMKKNWIWKSLPESRFEVVAECPDIYNLKLLFRIKSELLSLETTYSCFLIYKPPADPSLLEDLITMQSIGSSNFIQSFYLIPLPPTPIIRSVVDQIHDNPPKARKRKGDPKLRKDGWMEIRLCEVLVDATNTIRLLFLLHGSDTMNFAGLVIQGIEFREL